MSLKYLVQEINEKCPGWGTAKILRKINECQNIIFSRPSPTTTYIDPTTGFPGYLSTTAGTFTYDIPDVVKDIGGTNYTLRVYKVSRVFVDISNYSNYDIPYLGDPFEFYGINPYGSNTEKIYFAAVPVESICATETARARINFKSDPGTTSTVFFIEAILEPLQITSVNIPLMIPRQFERAIYDFVVGDTQDEAYGEDGRMTRFYEYWLPKIYDEITSGAKAVSAHTPVFF